MRATLISIFVLVLVSDCATTGAKYELKQSAEVREQAVAKPVATYTISFTESW